MSNEALSDLVEAITDWRYRPMREDEGRERESVLDDADARRTERRERGER